MVSDPVKKSFIMSKNLLTLFYVYTIHAMHSYFTLFEACWERVTFQHLLFINVTNIVSNW